eukprot:756513-Hanusia_phi.AAC.3
MFLPRMQISPRGSCLPAIAGSKLPLNVTCCSNSSRVLGYRSSVLYSISGTSTSFTSVHGSGTPTVPTVDSVGGITTAAPAFSVMP